MKTREFWPFVLPSLIVMTLLMVFPLVFTIFLSFHNYTFGSEIKFVGLTNFVRVLADSRFWNSFGFTFAYIALVLPFQITLGFTLALFLNEITRFQRLFVSGYLIPFVVTPVVGTLIVAWLFKDRGFYTYLLSLVGINIQWYADALASRGLLIMYGIWYTTPFAMLMLYSGLQAMSLEPIEAAIVDGATWLERVRFVMIPYLQPIFLFIIMIGLMDGFRLFDSVAVMTQGGPGGATETIMFFAYSTTFSEQLIGKGSAIVVLAVIGIVICLSPFLLKTYRDIVRAAA